MRSARFGICFLLSALIASPLFSQFEKVVEFDHDRTWFSSDYQGSIYFINDDSLVKIIPPYHHFFSYHFRTNEIPEYIDVSNPHQIVCYFRTNKQVILLDSVLNTVLRPFYLDEIGLYDIDAIVSSKDMGLWFYDGFTNRLTKLDKNFIPVIKPVDLNRYFSRPHKPSFLTEYTNSLYIDVPAVGILVLHANGHYKTAFNVEGIPDFQVLENSIYYYRDNIIYKMDMTTLKKSRIYLPAEPDILNAHYHSGYRFIQTKRKIIVYKEKK